jgi:hypothetical protein
MNDMENIKKLLDGYEAPYDHNDWIKLEKDLPKSPGMSGLTKTILVATALIIAVGSVIILSQVINNDDNKTEQLTSTQIPESYNSEGNTIIKNKISENESEGSDANSNIKNIIDNNSESNIIENKITDINQQETSNEDNIVVNENNNTNKA